MKARNFDYTEYGFVVVCLLSHGDRRQNEDYIMGTDGGPVNFRQDILSYFADGRCSKTLYRKLKLFIVQACRGRVPQYQIPWCSVVQDGPKMVCSPAIMASAVLSYT